MSRSRMAVVAALLMVGLSGFGFCDEKQGVESEDVIYWVGENDGDETVDKAHQQLLEAVDTIRLHRVKDGADAIVISELAAHRLDSDRPRLGLVLGPGHEDGREGVLVMAVTPGSSAADVGLEAGDLIVRVGDVNLENLGGGAVAKVISMSRALEEGQTITLEYLHDGELYSVEVEARKLDMPIVFPGQQQWTKHADIAKKDFFTNVIRFPSVWMDLELVSLNDELGEYFEAHEGVLVVRGPEDDSLGLRGGDVILEIGGRMVKSPEHALRILRSYESDEDFLISIVRHGRSETLQVTVPEQDLQRFDLQNFYFNRAKE